MTCRWDSEAAAYVTPDSEECDTPKRDHCTARRTCSQHLAWGELTCARCLGRVRQDIRQIEQLAALMLPEAMVVGVESEAASLAGPAGDPVVVSWRRIDASRLTGLPIGDGHDDTDPTAVLGTWQAMLSEDYGHDLPDRITLSTAVAYLDRNLGKVAQDEDQDFRLMAREIHKCRQHLESVLRDSQAPERGAPCPECAADRVLVKLVREYPHWCDDPGCCREHWDTDAYDVWRCPRDPEHAWDMEAYSKYIEERRGA